MELKKYYQEIEQYLNDSIKEYKEILQSKDKKTLTKIGYIFKNVIEKYSFLASSYKFSNEEKKEFVVYITKNFLYRVSDTINIPYIPTFLEKILFKFFIEEVLSEVIEYVYQNVVKPRLIKIEDNIKQEPKE